jgi:hypothetical protein
VVLPIQQQKWIHGACIKKVEIIHVRTENSGFADPPASTTHALKF